MSGEFTFLPARPGESDQEQRIREALDRQARQMLSTLDGSLRLREAPGSVSRARALAKTALEEFCVKAMHAFVLNEATGRD